MDLGNKKGERMNERTKEQYTKLNIKEVVTQSDISNQFIYIGNQRVDIAYQNSNLGKGIIPFFICPSCGNRRREIYLVSDSWECYKCQNLVYSSQQRKKSDSRYWYDRAEKEARKIDPNFRIIDLNDVLNYELNFPMFKPKNMKQSKFDTIRFWYGMYMFRGICIFSKSLAPARKFLEETRRNAKRIEQQLKGWHE